MQRSPVNWSSGEVSHWLFSINCGSAVEMFEFHGIEGKDLLELTEEDLRLDFKLTRVHDRKYLMRKIKELKNLHSATVEVEFEGYLCYVRVSDLDSYTFDQLRKDTATYFGVSKELAFLEDKHGLLWGSLGVGCIFDSSLRQQEPVHLKTSDQVEKHQQVLADDSLDSEDLKEENPSLDFQARLDSIQTQLNQLEHQSRKH